MSGSNAVGYIGAIVASVFFGSNYVPTKNFPQGDGFSFVWVFSAGVLTVGIFSMFITGHAVFVYTGLIGGAMWATGNLCVIPIVKLIGLGLGQMLWGSASLITGFLMGKTHGFGLGLKQEAPANEGMNWAGFLLVVGAMLTFFFIKPTLEEETQPLLEKDGAGGSNGSNRYQIQQADPPQQTIYDKIPPKFKIIAGSGLAVFSGMLYGVCMLPMSLWVQHQDELNIKTKPLDFVLSHFIGIYLYSTVVFLVYCVVHRPPQIFPESILPSYISGAMWGIAQCGLMSATQILGYAIGFPIANAGPLIVASLWSVLYFREIRGMRNYLFLGASYALLGAGIALLSLSHGKKK